MSLGIARVTSAPAIGEPSACTTRPRIRRAGATSSTLSPTSPSGRPAASKVAKRRSSATATRTWPSSAKRKWPVSSVAVPVGSGGCKVRGWRNVAANASRATGCPSRPKARPANECGAAGPGAGAESSAGVGTTVRAASASTGVSSPAAVRVAALASAAVSADGVGSVGAFHHQRVRAVADAAVATAESLSRVAVGIARPAVAVVAVASPVAPVAVPDSGRANAANAASHALRSRACGSRVPRSCASARRSRDSTARGSSPSLAAILRGGSPSNQRM